VWIRGIPGVVPWLIGSPWISQGTDAVRGSSMSGYGRYAALDVVSVLVGFAPLARAGRVRAVGPRRSG
jgi:hypothetical protein